MTVPPKAPSGPEIEPRNVFISYGVKVVGTWRGLVMKALVDRGYSVFMNMESLKQGKFNEAILRRIELAKDVVVICNEGSIGQRANADNWGRPSRR